MRSHRRRAPRRSPKGTGLIDAITARERSQRGLEIAEQNMLRVAKEFQGVSHETEKARGARLKSLAPKLLGRAGEVSKTIDSHFAALEALFDEAEAVAQEIDESFAEVSAGGAAYYAPEMNENALGGVLTRGALREAAPSLQQLLADGDAAALIVLGERC